MRDPRHTSPHSTGHRAIALRLLREERGFTLVETLVAVIGATAVVGALYAILIIAIGQASRASDYEQASQLGRVTMTRLTEKLDSACISTGFAPVQEKSGETKLIFRNVYSSEAEIKKAFQQEVFLEKNVLYDKSTESSSGSWPNFTYEGTKVQTRLGEHVFQTTELNSKKEEVTVPVFKYFKFEKKTETLKNAGASEALNTLKEIEYKGTEKVLGTTEAKEAAAVEVSFRQAPADGYTNFTQAAAKERMVDLKNVVTLSFSSPDAENPIEEKPCE